MTFEFLAKIFGMLVHLDTGLSAKVKFTDQSSRSRMKKFCFDRKAKVKIGKIRHDADRPQPSSRPELETVNKLQPVENSRLRLKLLVSMRLRVRALY